MANVTEINTAIMNGELDNTLEEISKAIVERRKIVARIGLFSIKAGDKIKFNKRVRPAYLAGLCATVVKVNGASVVVETPVSPAYSRFSGHKNLRVPASLVEKI